MTSRLTAGLTAALTAALVAVFATTACGGVAAPVVSGDTVTVRTATGEATVPVTDTGIWALDQYSAISLLAVGVTVDNAAVTHQGLNSRIELLSDAGVRIARPHEPELVAAAAPSLIVGVDHPDHRALLDRYRAIAPVVLLPQGGAVDGRLSTLGAVTGRGDEAAAVQNRIDAATTALADRLAAAGHAGTTVSVLQHYPPTFYAYNRGSAFAAILDRLGLDRPPTQDGGSEYGYVEVSEERLTEQRADVIVAFVDDVYSRGRSVFDSPVFDTSGSITAEVEFSGWYTDDVLSIWWVLHDVAAILLDHSPPATAAEVPELWAGITTAR